MANIAIQGSLIKGITAGEHSGHLVPHAPCELTGSIVSNCSNFVFIEGVPIAIVGSVTREYDCCCSGDYGVISTGSALIFNEGISVARVGDKITPHNGTASIITGSSFVMEV